MSTVFLLGAGFSRAVSAAMPLMRGLTQIVRARYNRTIPDDIGALMEEDFETAMSFLAQPKPWLPETDNLRHRALLLDIANVIAGALDQATHDATAAMTGEAPAWLESMIRYWHRNRSTVLTLNYDTLVEVVSAGIGHAGQGTPRLHCRQVYPRILTDADSRAGMHHVGDDIDTFRLLKLHGSINWFYSGRAESFGEPIYFVDVVGPAEFWRHRETRRDRRVEAILDKYPFVVPPVFEKAPLFSHETIRSLWFTAANALQNADRLVCIGYSLPPSDLTMRYFLKSAMKRQITVEVVNLTPGMDVHYRTVIGAGDYRVEQRFSGERSVADFAATLSS